MFFITFSFVGSAAKAILLALLCFWAVALHELQIAITALAYKLNME
jgi:hypothetical protein